MDYLFIFILGIVIGSFLNVCIYRIPLDESIISPSSHCTDCGTPLAALDLIPLFSWIFIKGRCRHCGTSISYKYTLVELLTGLLFLYTYAHLGYNVLVFVYLFIICILIVDTFIDLEHLIIPDIMHMVGVGGFIIFNISYQFIPWGEAILGAILGAVPFLIIVFVTSGGGMGMGDVKLMAMIGLFIGWKMALLTVFLSFVLGGIIGIFLLVTKIKNRHDPIPFGPWISLAALVVLFYGEPVLYWYLGLIGIG